MNGLKRKQERQRQAKGDGKKMGVGEPWSTLIGSTWSDEKFNPFFPAIFSRYVKNENLGVLVVFVFWWVLTVGLEGVDSSNNG